MTYTIKNFKRDVSNRSMFKTDMQTIWTAIVVADETGDWLGVSRWDDEEHWIVDCAFRANGFPVFSNGTGSRVTGARTVIAEIAERLGDLCVDMLEEEASASMDSYLRWEQDSYSHEAEEESLGRPLMPNEY